MAGVALGESMDKRFLACTCPGEAWFGAGGMAYVEVGNAGGAGEAYVGNVFDTAGEANLANKACMAFP